MDDFFEVFFFVVCCVLPYVRALYDVCEVHFISIGIVSRLPGFFSIGYICQVFLVVVGHRRVPTLDGIFPRAHEKMKKIDTPLSLSPRQGGGWGVLTSSKKTEKKNMFYVLFLTKLLTHDQVVFHSDMLASATPFSLSLFFLFVCPGLFLVFLLLLSIEVLFVVAL